MDDGVHLLVRLAALVGHHRQADGRLLPQIIVVHLGDRDVEASLEAVDGPAQHLPLGFEGTALGNGEGETSYADDHLAPLAISRGSAKTRRENQFKLGRVSSIS